MNLFLYKRTKTFLFALSITLLFTHCEKDLLDFNPTESISDEFAIVDGKSAETALLGVYNKLQSSSYYGGDGYQAAAYLSGGDLLWVGTLNYYATFINHTYRADNRVITDAWYAIFRAVNGANHIIAKVPSLSTGITEQQKKQLVGEAYFLRALAYFDLARAWGNVPIVLQPTNTVNDANGIRQSTQGLVYDQVLADLNAAEALLDESINRNRATKNTVYALKARLHLYRKQWQEAEDFASRIINQSNQYNLIDWQTFINTKNSNESIFELAFSTLNTSAHFGSWSSISYRNQFAPNRALYELTQSAQTGGERKLLISDNSSTAIPNYFVQHLYWRTTNDNPTYILRVAEQYLIRAEARAQLNKLNDAIADLNAVRTRAKTALFQSNSQEAILRAIEDERRVEFALEPHRWFDLIRTERASTLAGATDHSKWIFPIPYNDIAADPDLVQNPGY
ncbi:RagB/SusD family nutrient uptake outer membrane protein [Olivibacter sp. CPCC 100613]|uniref:RagB/SusD family nutrient uptake outer membrane protein n=1 Tax=Olivibacter sp. CPCC 100613 TaxID=3079931 RepID=UPI002FF8A670